MANFPHVPPLTPDMIPVGCYAKWNEVTWEWEFPSLEELKPVQDAPVEVWNITP
jgi:hypothetical protein